MALFSQTALPGQAVAGAAVPGAGSGGTSGASVSSLTLTNSTAAPSVTTSRIANSAVTLTNTATGGAQTSRTAASTATLTNTASGGLRGQASSSATLVNSATSSGLGYTATASATASVVNSSTATLRLSVTSQAAVAVVNSTIVAVPGYSVSLLTVSNSPAGYLYYSIPTPAPIVVPDWRTLTPAVLAQLLASTDVTLDTGIELLNFDLSLNSNLSAYLDTTTGDILWDGTQQVHRVCEVVITTALQWGIALLKVYRVMTDNPSGIVARFDRGVFVLNTPDTVLGSTVIGTDGSAQIAYDVTGQDRTYLLDRLLPDSYTVAAGTNVLTAIAAVFAAAGLSGYLIDSSASSSTVPSDMAWPLVPADNTDTSTVTLADGTQVDNSSGPTWRSVINDLCSLVTYRAVWADEQGMFRVGPYVNPKLRQPTQVFDATAFNSTLGTSRDVAVDLWSIPNQWTFVWANIPDSTDSSGNTISTTPTQANGGIYTVNNFSTGLSSQTSRNGLVFPAPIQSLTAASPQDLQNQANAIVAAAQQVTTTVTTTVSPNPSLSHFDIGTYTESTGSEQVQVLSWTENFDNSDTAITAGVAM